MTKKQGGIGRHGYGTKYKKKPAHLAGENGQQAAAQSSGCRLRSLRAPLDALLQQSQLVSPTHVDGRSALIHRRSELVRRYASGARRREVRRRRPLPPLAQRRRPCANGAQMRPRQTPCQS